MDERSVVTYKVAGSVEEIFEDGAADREDDVRGIDGRQSFFGSQRQSAAPKRMVCREWAFVLLRD